MQFRQFITAASLALFSMAASAAQIVIPAAGSSAGVGGSQWQSELTLHNTASHNVTVSVTYHQGAEVSAPVLIDVAARGTASIADIVNTRFARGGTGALVIDIADA
ncbi:MAG TPA: hypothetical protein VN181_13285, partial [Thermoanaerobaculia bacterium]|nr:hypothetical protein [Thermoanaerobaculia bacterium]